jgi:2-phosphosulfolactate phosphatase
MNDLEICYLPAQWRNLEGARLRQSACAVIDVIRATSTIVTALANGASGVQPVAEVGDAFALKAQNPEALLAGERGGKPLPGFDLGNSPEEFTAERVGGRRVILTTTNGTQALAACREARVVITASLLNLDAAAARLRELGPPWLIVCAGHEGGFGVDDALVAGALAEALNQEHALVSLYRSVAKNVAETFRGSLAGRELVKVWLEKDLAYCAQRNLFQIVPTLHEDGVLTIYSKSLSS